MSFARAKITRFNEKPALQPNGAVSGLKAKSQIPKINKPFSAQSPRDPPRPLTSPGSVSGQRRHKNGTGEGPNVGKPCNMTALKENSIHSDDYKDALDDKTETDNVDSLRGSTQISIAVKESLASKSSNSGRYNAFYGRKIYGITNYVKSRNFQPSFLMTYALDWE
ncbi:hypothetical protein Trydic_g270 [Trypoxylus dichotomus]